MLYAYIQKAAVEYEADNTFTSMSRGLITVLAHELILLPCERYIDLWIVKLALLARLIAPSSSRSNLSQLALSERGHSWSTNVVPYQNNASAML